jgi:hypothetical protein
MKRFPLTLEQSRQIYTKDARQVQVEGVADTVATGYVRDYGQGRAAYLVFYGKQSKPADYYSARSVAEAEQRVVEALTAAGQAALQKAAARKQPRAPYHESEHGGVITRSYTTAGTAQLIREALKVAFPGIKFSVTSDTFANGSSVHIGYTDGPTWREVETITGQFKSGHFNSMEDIYEYKDEPVELDASGRLVRTSYGAKYISVQRNYSPAYGSYLNGLDLRQAPGLALQFKTFFSWHCAQRCNTRSSYGHNAGRHVLESDGHRSDLEQFAAALTVQGHTPVLTATQEGTELTVVEPLTDEIDRQFYAAEMAWLQAA